MDGIRTGSSVSSQSSPDGIGILLRPYTDGFTDLKTEGRFYLTQGNQSF